MPFDTKLCRIVLAFGELIGEALFNVNTIMNIKEIEDGHPCDLLA